MSTDSGMAAVRHACLLSFLYDSQLILSCNCLIRVAVAAISIAKSGSKILKSVTPSLIRARYSSPQVLHVLKFFAGDPQAFVSPSYTGHKSQGHIVAGPKHSLHTSVGCCMSTPLSLSQCLFG